MYRQKQQFELILATCNWLTHLNILVHGQKYGIRLQHAARAYCSIYCSIYVIVHNALPTSSLLDSQPSRTQDSSSGSVTTRIRFKFFSFSCI